MEKASKPDLFRDKPKHPNKKLKMVLPLPPSINHMYYNTQRGGKRLTGRANDYIKKSKALINLAIEEQRWVQQSKYTWYYIDLAFFMPDRRIRDSHNMLKLLLDVMEGTVFNNDYCALPRIQTVEYDKENPRIEMCIASQTNNSREKALEIIS